MLVLDNQLKGERGIIEGLIIEDNEKITTLSFDLHGRLWRGKIRFITYIDLNIHFALG